MCNAFIVKNASCAKCTLCKVFVVESVDLRFSENWNQCSEPMNKPSIGNLTHFFYKTLHAIFINDTDLYTKHAPVIISLLAQVFCPRPDQTRPGVLASAPDRKQTRTATQKLAKLDTVITN